MIEEQETLQFSEEHLRSMAKVWLLADKQTRPTFNEMANWLDITDSKLIKQVKDWMYDWLSQRRRELAKRSKGEYHQLACFPENFNEQ